MVDFYASWCGPCNTMDDQVWSREDVATAQQPFVNVRIDVTHDQTSLRQHQLKGIPALLIIDPRGNEYFRRVGYMRHGEVLSELGKYPTDMQAAYAAEVLVAQDDAFNTHFLLARDYQRTARRASGSVRANLALRSTDALEAALELLHATANAPENLNERLNLMLAENLVLRGRAKKALKQMAAYTTLDADNEALGCYIRGLAYHNTKQMVKAEECYTALQEAADNGKYLALYAAQTR